MDGVDIVTNPITWRDIAPADATDIDCRTRPDLKPPLNENQEVCPWPWEPQQLVGAPLGQYRCGYCGAMCVAGMPHVDYSDKAHPLVGKRVTVTTVARPGQTLNADATHTGTLVSWTYDGDATLRLDDDTTIHVWPAVDITEEPR